MHSATRNALSLFKGTGFRTEAFTREQGSHHDTGLWPVRNRTARRAVSGRRGSRAPSGFTAAPPGSRPRRALSGRGQHQSLAGASPAANRACEGSECALFTKTIQKPALPAPWENVGFRETRPRRQKLGDPFLSALSWEFW